jgi:HEPN domain-containing protein
MAARSGHEEEARRWWLQAQHDLRAAAWNVEGGFYDTACFLTQQAAEKALKSLHYHLGSARRVLLTHSVVTLLQRASRGVPELAHCLEGGRELDLHYVPSRYPNGLPSGYPHEFYAQETAQRAIAASQRIVAAIEAYYRGQGIRWEEE